MTRDGHPKAHDGHPETRAVPETAGEDRPVTPAPENGDAR
jgi:hypothetical protein